VQGDAVAEDLHNWATGRRQICLGREERGAAYCYSRTSRGRSRSMRRQRRGSARGVVNVPKREAGQVSAPRREWASSCSRDARSTRPRRQRQRDRWRSRRRSARMSAIARQVADALAYGTMRERGRARGHDLEELYGTASARAIGPRRDERTE
jgi:hypothetical protein